MDMYKLMNLQSFSYYEDGLDRGLAIREKAILLQDLVQQPQRLEVERDQARQYREKFHPQSTSHHGGYSSYGGDTNTLSMGSQGQGYGGYGGPKQEESGIIGNAVGALGTVASGVGSVLSSGMSYIGSFRGGQQAPDNQPGKMMGFGSDSYQGYMGGGGGGSNYAPPGGGPQSSYALSGGSSGYEKKWGAATSP